MREIVLTKGYVALIDDEDYEAVSQYRWSVTKSSCGYIRATSRIPVGGGKQKTIYMSRLVMGVTDPDVHVDHINHNTLDNRKGELRLCSNKQNRHNINATQGKFFVNHAATLLRNIQAKLRTAKSISEVEEYVRQLLMENRGKPV